VRRRAAIDEMFQEDGVFHDPELDSAAHNTFLYALAEERHFALVEGLCFTTARSTTGVRVLHNKRSELQVYLGF
jgi:hypothetical protein